MEIRGAKLKSQTPKGSALLVGNRETMSQTLKHQLKRSAADPFWEHLKICQIHWAAGT